jgi:Ca2+-binding EF-hand superfamily protein
MNDPVKVTLTKPEFDELLLTTSFEREEISNMKDHFASMQTQPEVCGKVSLAEFTSFLKLKEESLLSNKLFEMLDFNKDKYLTFWDIVNSLDNFHQKQFKTKLKFYFELFCDQDKEINKAKFTKMSKEIIDQFPHLVLPADFILGQVEIQPISKNLLTLSGTTPKKTSSDMKEVVQIKASGGSIITLDEFYDHFEKVYPTLA